MFQVQLAQMTALLWAGSISTLSGGPRPPRGPKTFRAQVLRARLVRSEKVPNSTLKICVFQACSLPVRVARIQYIMDLCERKQKFRLLAELGYFTCTSLLVI